MLLYAGLSLVTNVAFNLLWWTITHKRRLLKPNVPEALVVGMRNQIAIGFPLYLAAVAATFSMAKHQSCART